MYSCSIQDAEYTGRSSTDIYVCRICSSYGSQQQQQKRTHANTCSLAHFLEAQVPLPPHHSAREPSPVLRLPALARRLSHRWVRPHGNRSASRDDKQHTFARNTDHTHAIRVYAHARTHRV